MRPGTYTLYAWQTQGRVTQSFAKDGVEIKGDTLDLGAIEWDAPYHPHLLFQIGLADRMADEFKFGSLPRTNQWMKQVPANLTFTVGQSKPEEDWYYAQFGGTWKIKFNVERVPEGQAYLTIAIAGGPGNLSVLVNDHEVGKIAKGDDASVRRAANRSGVYARFEFEFAASLLKAGENLVSLQMAGRGESRAAATEDEPTGQQPGSAANNGLMYDTIVLETN